MPEEPIGDPVVYHDCSMLTSPIIGCCNRVGPCDYSHPFPMSVCLLKIIPSVWGLKPHLPGIWSQSIRV